MKRFYVVKITTYAIRDNNDGSFWVQDHFSPFIGSESECKQYADKLNLLCQNAEIVKDKWRLSQVKLLKHLD